jgi:hypothetical protein
MTEEGAFVLGLKPTDSPGMRDDRGEFKKIADQLWKNTKGENNVGKGKVFSDMNMQEVLAAMQIKPDFEHNKVKDSQNLLFVHRRLSDADIYWVDNRRDSAVNLQAVFRIAGKAVEIWHPETGKTERVSYNISDGRTKVPILLEPYDAVFVVFSKNTNTASFKVSQNIENQLVSLSGDWLVKFQPERGAPAEVTFNSLSSWSNNTDEGIKYFSGTGNYFKSFEAQEIWFKPGNRLLIDLGNVKNLAEVLVNGRNLGIIWRKPFRVDVTDAIKPGTNKLEIRVTNLWVNRLIGDQQPGIKNKYTYTTQAFYSAKSALSLSGLLGPVQILSVTDK